MPGGVQSTATEADASEVPGGKRQAPARSRPSREPAGASCTPAATSIRDFVPVTQDVPCDFCGGERFRFFLRQDAARDQPEDGVVQGCGLAQTNPQPTAESLGDVLRSVLSPVSSAGRSRRGVRGQIAADGRPAVSAGHAVFGSCRAGAVLEVGPGAGEFLAEVQGEVGLGSAWAWSRGPSRTVLRRPGVERRARGFRGF